YDDRQQLLVGDAHAGHVHVAGDQGRAAEKVSAEREQQGFLKDQRQRDGGDQHGRLVLAHRLDDQFVTNHAQGGYQSDGEDDGNQHGQAGDVKKLIHAVSGEHVKRGVRDVDDARHAEDEREAYGQERVHASIYQPGDQDVLKHD